MNFSWLRSRVARFAAAFLALVVIALVLMAVMAWTEQRAQQHEAELLNQPVVSIIKRGLGDDLQIVRGDVLALGQTLLVEQELAAASETLRARTERLFATLAQARGDYAQLRLIDVGGHELARVNTSGHGSTSVPPDQLQDKNQRPYVAAINQLGPGQLYVSQLDLNMEHGKIVQPREPSLRVGTPIFAADGLRLGMLIINLDGSRLLSRIEDDARAARGSVWLTDRDGNWLIGPDRAREWRFMNPDAPPAGLSTDFPDAWAKVRAGGSGHARGAFGVLSFDELTLSSAPNAPMLRVIALAPPLTIGGILIDRGHLLGYALLLPLLLILAAWLAELGVRLTLSQGEIAANSRLLQDIFEHSNLSMKVKNLDGRIVRANETAGVLLGRPPAELIGQTIDAVATPRTAAMVRAHDREVLEGGQVTTYEEQADYLGGSHTLLTTRFPVTDPTGHIVGVGAISVDITPRIRMEQWLWLAKEQAEAATVAKATFLANMSHELRTPLNSIIGLGELLMEQAEETHADPMATESLQRVVGAGRHLLALINDILNLSRIEAGHVELAPETVIPALLVENVVDGLRPLAAANGNALLTELPTDRFTAWLDPMRFRQVLLNLLGNAIKFTRDGQIVVRVTCSDDMLMVSVADTGIGMTEEHVARIFKPFEQADRSIARRFGGTGLGLAISHQLTELMGGRIEVASALGQGSIFTLVLPMGQAEAALAPQREERAIRDRDGRHHVVLVVDDDDSARKLLCRTLERDGLHTISAASGLEALAMVRSERPAVMLLDILLGDMSGWDVLTVLRADPAHADLPVILCTVTDPDHRTSTLGVIEHLTKPIDRDHLRTLVRRFVGTDAPMTVMLVDDDDHYREQLALVLRREGHRVLLASSGEIALYQMRQQAPDLVLLDLIMPGMDGLSVIAAMRSETALAGIQVVLLTAAEVPRAVLDQLNERAITLVRKGESDLEQIVLKARDLIARVERTESRGKDAPT